MSKDVLKFSYRNASGEISQSRQAHDWVELGYYFEGYCPLSGQRKTFRKDRVLAWLDGTDSLLREPRLFPPPRIPTRDDQAQILFTGFKAKERAALELQAEKAGLWVVTKVTKGLAFLVAGGNAGPSKVRDAMETEGCVILDSDGFSVLIKTGELPQEAVWCE